MRNIRPPTADYVQYLYAIGAKPKGLVMLQELAKHLHAKLSTEPYQDLSSSRSVSFTRRMVNRMRQSKSQMLRNMDWVKQKLRFKLVCD